MGLGFLFGFAEEKLRVPLTDYPGGISKRRRVASTSRISDAADRQNPA